MPSQVGRLRHYFALERDLVLVSGAMLLLAFGEQLWKKFAPKFLAALGAPILAIGLYGTIHDALDGLYQYPGGWLSDRIGRRRSLLLIISAACVGYAIYTLAGHWGLIFVGLLLVMTWQSMGSPTLFAIIGDTLPRQQRAMGFTVQSILRRIPIVVAPLCGGLLIARLGILDGFRFGTALTVIAALTSLVLVRQISATPAPFSGPLSLRGVWSTLAPRLRRLLVSDIFARTCEGMVDVFLVLYAIDVVGITAPQFGILIAVQMITSIVIYLPIARWSDRAAREPFVALTFLAFAIFPLAVVQARSFATLAGAFVIAGLRELGEPSRKALIVDLIQPQLRGRSVGLYYLIRSLAIAPAALVGGLLWETSPELPFYVAAAVGSLGTAVFLLTVRDA